MRKGITIITNTYLLTCGILALTSTDTGLRVWCTISILVFVINFMQPQKLTRLQRLRRNGGKHTTGEWLLLKFYYGNRCAACGKRSAKLTKDHILPVSKGGNDNISNIQPLCDICNKSKGTKIIRY